jgi:hypothetical protein
MTPQEAEEARQRGHELRRLTDRFGEWYRIWYDRGLFWAERDGDRLSGDSAAALTAVLCEHIALCRDRAHQAAHAAAQE